MSLINCEVCDLVYYSRDYRTGDRKIVPNTENTRKLKNPKDTYLVIFGPDQSAQMEWFLKQPQWTIVYRGIRARNKNYSDYDQGRNTLFIFEYNKPKA